MIRPVRRRRMADIRVRVRPDEKLRIEEIKASLGARTYREMLLRAGSGGRTTRVDLRGVAGLAGAISGLRTFPDELRRTQRALVGLADGLKAVDGAMGGAAESLEARRLLALVQQQLRKLDREVVECELRSVPARDEIERVVRAIAT